MIQKTNQDRQFVPVPFVWERGLALHKPRGSYNAVATPQPNLATRAERHWASVIVKVARTDFHMKERQVWLVQDRMMMKMMMMMMMMMIMMMMTMMKQTHEIIWILLPEAATSLELRCECECECEPRWKHMNIHM